MGPLYLGGERGRDISRREREKEERDLSQKKKRKSKTLRDTTQEKNKRRKEKNNGEVKKGREGRIRGVSSKCSKVRRGREIYFREILKERSAIDR